MKGGRRDPARCGVGWGGLVEVRVGVGGWTQQVGMWSFLLLETW